MISFRKLQDTKYDYLLLTKWLNNPAVRRWYGYDNFIEPPNFNDVREEFKRKVLDDDNLNADIIIADGIEIGYIQYYETLDYLNERNVYGIDLFIGNDDYRGKGYGSKILKQTIAHIFKNKEVMKIIIDPEHNNMVAIKCYLKAGFKELRRNDNHLIMVINRE